MNKNLSDEIRNLGGDPLNEVWRWFISNGPHGPNFTWGQTKNHPRGYVGVEHLQKIIIEKGELFSKEARNIALTALSSSDPNFIRRGIQIAAVTGDETELRKIIELTTHESESVVSDAKAGLFYLKKKLG